MDKKDEQIARLLEENKAMIQEITDMAENRAQLIHHLQRTQEIVDMLLEKGPK